MFVIPAMAPRCSAHRKRAPRTGAVGFGLLFAALGTGAVLGALVLRRVTTVSTNGILPAASVLYAATLAVMSDPSFAAALAILVLNGLAWMAITSTLQAEMQLVLPAWVRARGMAIYVVIFMGSQTTGALLWGLVANRFVLRPAVLTAACVVLAAAIAGLIWRLPETGHLDPKPAVYWTDPRVAFDPEPDTGPVLVAVHLTVTADRQSEFLAAMDQLRLSRHRTGATRWELYRDAEHRDRFVEIFRVSSWEEHLRQHEGRLTATDQVVEEAALAFSDPPAYGDHLLPP
jgi:hypothetical protein